MVKACIARGVGYLTLFAFSSENWRGRQEEVSFLMNLFVSALQGEVGKLHATASGSRWWATCPPSSRAWWP
jgi:undecaprenyl diphosphate synthase